MASEMDVRTSNLLEFKSACQPSLGLAALAAGVLLAGSTFAETLDEGWRNLFADDLSNAECDRQSWHRDAGGVLVSEAGVALWTKDGYSDYELLCEYCLGSETDGGVFVYASGTTNLIPNAVAGPRTAAYNPAKPAGQWNALGIRAEGRKLLVVLNGIPVNECELCIRDDGATSDRIGFRGRQCAADLKFRNVRIRSLSKKSRRVTGCRSDGVGLERTDVPRAGVRCAAECGEAIGPAKVWDFTAGKLPEGCRLQKDAFLSERGLGCNDFTNLAAAGGVSLPGERTPQGAFLLEAEIEVGNSASDFRREHNGRIWDDMGIGYGSRCDNTGLEVNLRQTADGYFHPQVCVGMGSDRYSFTGERIRLYRGARTKFALFFGANGRLVIEFAGLVAEETVPVAGPLVPGKRYRPAIGSRPVSNYWNFDGFVRRVTLTPMRQDPIVFRTPGRMAFERGETNTVCEIVVANRSGDPLSGVCVKYEQFCDEGRVKTSEVSVGDMAEGETVEVPFSPETRVRPGWHQLRASLEGRGADGRMVSFAKLIRYGIGPKYADRLRTTMWGLPAALPGRKLRDFGFTHGYVYAGGSSELVGGYDPKKLFNLLDNALVEGLGLACIHMPLLAPAEADKLRYLRYDRTGQPYKTGWGARYEVSNPELRERFRVISERTAECFADHPAFQGVLPFTERRDLSRPSFNTEHLRYKAETGRDVPAGADGQKWDPDFAARRFPDGVVPEDDDYYVYYKWFLGGGDGWPSFLSAAFDEFRKRIGRPSFMSFWDPAARWAPIWGSGGSADMLNQWCYAVPEPMNAAGPCEEILAMADGRQGQKASIMTQLICYRSKMAPADKPVLNMPEWAKRLPDLQFPTIPPDVLAEATWSMLAKPVQSIMYHGWDTICDMHVNKHYGFSNPESAIRIGELLNGVVAPLGPTLKRLDRRAPDVAVLESFTTCAMGGPASWGWSAPAVTCLQRARLDPRVVYEQTILRDGLGGVRVLYAPQCRFLTPTIVAKILEFQKRGGVLVADDELLPALKADVKIPIQRFEAPPESDHAEDVEKLEAAKDPSVKSRKATVRAKTYMQESGEVVRKALAERGYVSPADSSSPEIVVYSRRFGETPYLFAISDKRTFGDYVGQWGLVMEKGVPNEGWVQIQDSSGAVGAVYELSKGGKVPFARKGSRVRVPVKYETSDGRLFAFLPAEIKSVDVAVAPSVRRGERLAVTMTVRDARGLAVPALLPVDIRLTDAAGREIDGVGYAAAENGVAKVSFVTNLDDADGRYRLVCTDRASGQSVVREINQK